MTLTAHDPRPHAHLQGRNAYAALAACMVAARHAGWSDAQIRAFRLRATSGSLEDLLRACWREFKAR